jgi:hypothetical protein
MGGAGSRLLGNRLLEAFMAACTSCSAMSRERLKSNCKVMTDDPAEEMDDISLRPGIWPNCFSKGAVTEVVITSGLAPGRKVCTWMVG